MNPNQPKGLLHRPLLEGKFKSPPYMLAIFLTVFLDLLAFGLFIPDLQLRAKELGATGALLGLVQASFSFAQLITAPLLGRLSDRYGRRSVLLISSLLSVISYVNYALAANLGMVVLSRVLSGIAAANLGVAFAYVADISAPEDRAKKIGMLGAAFGLGFMLGPPTGAALLHLAHGSPILLGFAGAILVGLNLLFILLFVPESRFLAADHGHAPQKSMVQLLRVAFSDPRLGLVLFIFFAISFGFTNLESTYFLLLVSPKAVFNLDPETARTVGAIILTFVGIVGAVTQGVLIGIANRRFGELRVLRTSSLFLAPALALIPHMPLWAPAILGVVLLGLSNGLTGPNINGLVSRLAPVEIRGAIFGVNQALGSFARMIGPLISNTLFFGVGPWSPYAVGAVIIFIGALLCWRIEAPPMADIQADPLPAEG